MTTAELILEYVQTLVWPIVAVAAMLLFRQSLTAAIGRLTGAELPGGVKLDFQKEIAKAEELSREAEDAQAQQTEKIESQPGRSPRIPLTEINNRLISLGLQASPSGFDLEYYRRLADDDPNVALAGLRMELEIAARNLAAGYSVDINPRDSAGRIFRKLYDNGAITRVQSRLADQVISLCNAAIHGTPVSKDDATSVIDIATTLADQFANWLSWGFTDGWEAPEVVPEKDG